MARIFVTGATGLLGHAVLPLLQAAGHETRALVRNPDAAARWSGQGSVTPVRGDMLDVPAWQGALEGCDAVLHLAACYTGYITGAAGEDTLMKTNVDATLRLAEAAERHAVGRMVFVSSAGVSRQGKAPIDESTAFDTGTDNAYFLSKIRAEQALDGFLAQAPRLSIVIARPSMMLGPDDAGPTPTGRFVRAYLRRELPVVLPGRAVIIDARDVAAALLRMLDIGEGGERFVLGGSEIGFADLYALLAQISGVPMPAKRPPYWLALTVMTVLKTLGRDVPVAPRDLRRMQQLIAPDASKMRNRLGVVPRPIEETLKDTVAWFQSRPDSAPIPAATMRQAG
jgi:dihydroflavonol-4-reductase